MSGTDLGAMWRYLHARTVARVLPRLGLVPPDRSHELERRLRALVERSAAFSLLQVGAYDGVSNDHVHRLIADFPQVRALLLEPQPAPCAALQARWRDVPRVRVLQCALADRSGDRPLYVIADEYKHLHPFPEQVSSFLHGQVAFALNRYAWRPPAGAITSIPVRTLDWQTLLRQYGPFDFVAIDTEGYDGEVLKQIEFGAASPTAILYEHRCLPRAAQREARALLSSHGYAVDVISKADTLAWLIRPA